ncbi:gluconokinase [Sphingomonas abietis]|uniref:Gluconokinase n=2 Tax=Sphingomonas abietis TaxID=3012344 RepID=A0ABY7NT35_9SPHN|nr:gluconokinase [Sphingomonas abietis]
MGVSGSGKSTLGRMLAAQLGCAFLEGDDFHSAENVAKMRASIPLTDEDRWPWLDRLGAASGEAATSDGLVVTACSALKRVYRERLAGAAHIPTVFVMLETNAQELTRRLGNRPGHYMPPSLLTSQLQTLEPPGADEAALILDSSEATAALCEQARNWIVRQGTKAG